MPQVSIKRIFKWVLGSLGLVILAILATPLGRYVLRAGWEEAKILSRREKIEDVIADSST